MRYSPLFTRFVSVAILSVAAAVHTLGAQTLGGQVVQLDGKKPLVGAAVALVNDSARVVATTSAGPDGSFFLDAPSAGSYRVVVLVGGASFLSPAIQLDSAKTAERQFSVPHVPDEFATALFARDVSSVAAGMPTNPVPKYPRAQLERGATALVSAMFVVDEKGRADLSTLQDLGHNDGAFLDAIRESLERSRFVPAEKDGSPVRQVIQYTYDFGMPNAPERGDIIIRPPVPQAAVEERTPSSGKYRLTSSELSKPEIEGLSIIEAMRRLRPTMFTQIGIDGSRGIGAGPIFVNDVRMEGVSALRDIRASEVIELRFWPREEAAMRFGTDYAFAITVKLRGHD